MGTASSGLLRISIGQNFAEVKMISAGMKAVPPSFGMDTGIRIKSEYGV